MLSCVATHGMTGDLELKCLQLYLRSVSDHSLMRITLSLVINFGRNRNKTHVGNRFVAKKRPTYARKTPNSKNNVGPMYSGRNSHMTEKHMRVGSAIVASNCPLEVKPKIILGLRIPKSSYILQDLKPSFKAWSISGLLSFWVHKSMPPHHRNHLVIYCRK